MLMQNLEAGGSNKVHYGRCARSSESSWTGQLSLFLLYIVFVKGMARLPDFRLKVNATTARGGGGEGKMRCSYFAGYQLL